MQSEIAKRLRLKYSPVAILFTNEKPPNALEFAERRWACVTSMLTAAAKGRKAVFNCLTFGCEVGGMGLGFKKQYPDSFEFFLSTGKAGMPEELSFKKTPELAKKWMESTPAMEMNEQYVVFAPLTEIDAIKDEPKVVVFYANPDQLSALVVLANYGRPGSDNVLAPFASGCQTICLLPVHEADREYPRAVIGMTDISARPYIDADLLSFSVPYALFREMENNVPGSFLDAPEWSKIDKRISNNH